MRPTRRRTVRIAVHSAKQHPTPQPVDLGVDDLASRLRFSFDSGHIWLGESRMLLLHGAALTALRKELIDSLGVDRARGMLLRIGYASGARDARWARTLYPAATDTELLGIGPALHMLEGVVRCTPDRMELDIEHGKFHGEFTWHARFHHTTAAGNQDPATPYALASAHVGKVLRVNNAATSYVSIDSSFCPPGLEGARFAVMKLNSGNVVVKAGTGITARFPAGTTEVTISDQFKAIWFMVTASTDPVQPNSLYLES